MISYDDFKKLPNLIIEHDVNYDDSRKGSFVAKSTLIETTDICYGTDLDDREVFLQKTIQAEDQACHKLYELLSKMFGA